MGEKKATIVLIAKDMASGNIGKVKSELHGLGGAGSVAASGLGIAQRAGSSLGGALSHAKSQVGGLIGSLGLLGGASVALGLGGFVEQGIAKVDEMGLAVEKLTGVTGLSAHAASQLVAVFGKFGLGVDDVTKIAGFAEKALGKLAQAHGVLLKSAALDALENQKLSIQLAGGKTKAIDLAIAHQKAADALKTGAVGLTNLTKLDQQFGLHLVDTKGKVVDFATELNQVADFYNSSASASDKASVAAQLFGRGYVALIPILKLGSKGIAEAVAEADKMGLTLKSAQDVANVNAFIAAQRNAKDAISGLEVQLGLLVMPDLTTGISAFTGYVTEHQDDIKKFFSGGLHMAEEVGGFLTGTLIPVVSKFAGAITSAWGSIPDPLRQLLVGGFVAQKASKWLFGSGPLDWIKSLASGRAGNDAGGVIGGMLGVQKVFVVNMGAGGMGGGLPVEAAPVAETGAAAETGWAAGGLAGLSAVVASVLGSAVVAGGIILLENKLTGTTAADIANRNVRGQFGPRSMHNLNATNTGTSGGGTWGAGLTQAQINATRAGERDTVTSGHLSSMISAALKGPLAANALAMAHGITSAFKESTGPSLVSMTSALGQLKTMQARYLSQGDTKLAASISGDIRYLSARVDAVTAAVNAKQFTVQAFNKVFGSVWPIGQSAQPPVHAAISVRDVTVQTQTFGRYGVARKII